MSLNKISFRSLEELEDSSITQKLASKEFVDQIPVEDFLENKEGLSTSNTSRRDFLKLLGFSSAAVTLAACEAPIIKAIPYVVKPGSLTPGLPTYYASTLYNGYDFSNVLVKTREGRPIKIESNKKVPYLGTTNSRTQASILSLYDNNKIEEPKVKGKSVSWKELDSYVIEQLAKVSESGKKIVLLTSSLPSPTTKSIVFSFGQKYSNFEHVIYDAISSSSYLDASEEVYGKRVIPVFDLSDTQLVVSFGSDFLSDSNFPGIEVSYANARKPTVNMLRHIQVESNLSLTGANADQRIPLKPSAVQKLLAEVYKSLTGSSSNKIANKIALELKAKGNKAVVLADGNKEVIKLSYLINGMLGSSAITQKALLLKESNDLKFNNFVAELEAGKIGSVLFYQANPIYSSSKADKIAKSLGKVNLLVGLSEYQDETISSSSNFVLAPVPSWLESWGDITPVTGGFSFQQPTIQKIFNSRQLQESLLVWSAQTDTNYYTYLTTFYNVKLGVSFDQALYNGYNEIEDSTSFSITNSNATDSVNNILNLKDDFLQLELYTSCALADGTQSNNPWLQELPDPISRISWDNYLSISKVDAEKLGLSTSLNGRMQLDADKVNIKVGGVIVKNIPVFIQPGQAVGSMGLALGYGRTKAGKVANNVGVNAYPLLNNSNKYVYNVSIEKIEGVHEFASVQLQNTLMGRYEIARDATLDEVLNKEVKEWNPPTEMHTHKGVQSVNKVDLWTTHDDTIGPKFNLSIDLNSCIGCGACVIACQAENNIPVVGKQEIRMSRDMFWLRIDRYYSSILPEGVDKDGDGEWSMTESIQDDIYEPEMYNDWLINPSVINPKVIFQPVMCQHCNHAPCETVCPVAATSHGRQGQNQMTYNRCVGTRYCANNCPYKVRRFNWFNYTKNDKFDYHMNNDLGRMVLNPDVAVRSRGVMEKCSMCIQLTQSVISKAKRDGLLIKDQDLQTACSKACSTGSIQFGNINDIQSKISELSKDNRKYVLLEEVGAKPNAFYHVKVRNENKV